MIKIIDRWTDKDSGIDCCSYCYVGSTELHYAIIADARQRDHGYRTLIDISLSLELAQEDIIPFGFNKEFLPHAIKKAIDQGRFVKLKD